MKTFTDYLLESNLAIGVFGVVAVLGGLYVYLYPYRRWRSTLKNVNGPPSQSLLFGALNQIFKVEPGVMHKQWKEEYGPTYVVPVLFGNLRLTTTDPVALNYILNHDDQIPKPGITRTFLGNMLGNGVLVAQGADHRRQRRVLNPSFSPQSIRDCEPVFFDKAEELKDVLLALLDDPTGAAPTPAQPCDVVQGGRKVDVMKFLGMCTIDVIGLAGFNYDFHALSEPKNELAEAFRNMFTAGQSTTPLSLIQALVPYADRLPTKRMRATWASRATTDRIGRRLIAEKKRAIAATHTTGLEKGDDIGKDLLSNCLRANMAADLKPEQRLSDDEVLAQITTFMLAGNETSSTALTWTLYLLSQNPGAQDKLRKECLDIADDRPSLDEIQALPYLEGVLHEALRLCSPVPGTVRGAAEDFVLPLSTPIKGRDGRIMDQLKVNKGTGIFLPISALNTSTEVWGPDADDFKPERHFEQDLPAGMAANRKAVPGVWGNILTFLGGTRNCIGYRFALAEMKVILFVLMRHLTFEELPSKPKIEKKSAIVMRPRVVGEEAAGLQMPLLMRAVQQD